MKDAEAWYEAQGKDAELMDIESKTQELEGKCKIIMQNYYRKSNSFSEEEEDDSHDEL